MGIQGPRAQRPAVGSRQCGFPSLSPTGIGAPESLCRGALSRAPEGACSILASPLQMPGVPAPPVDNLTARTVSRHGPLPGPGHCGRGLRGPMENPRCRGWSVGTSPDWFPMPRLLAGPLVRAGGKRGGLRGRETGRCPPGANGPRRCRLAVPAGGEEPSNPRA